MPSWSEALEAIRAEIEQAQKHKEERDEKAWKDLQEFVQANKEEKGED